MARCGWQMRASCAVASCQKGPTRMAQSTSAHQKSSSLRKKTSKMRCEKLKVSLSVLTASGWLLAQNLQKEWQAFQQANHSTCYFSVRFQLSQTVLKCFPFRYLKKRFGGDPGVAKGGSGVRGIEISASDQLAGIRVPTRLVNFYEEECGSWTNVFFALCQTGKVRFEWNMVWKTIRLYATFLWSEKIWLWTFESCLNHKVQSQHFLVRVFIFLTGREDAPLLRGWGSDHGAETWASTTSAKQGGQLRWNYTQHLYTELWPWASQLEINSQNCTMLLSRCVPGRWNGLLVPALGEGSERPPTTTGS